MFSALALSLAPFIFTAPAHADDSNTVSISVDPSAQLTQQGNLYKATTNVTVKTGKPYGFNLTMQADTADLVNSKDSTHKISATPSTTPVALNANQWGYSLSKSATTFSAVPAATQSGDTATPAVIADVTKDKPAGCTNPANCTKQVIFAANVDPAKLASGSYSAAITYTATAKPKPFDWLQRTAKTDPSELCRSGDNNSSCLVDLDKNMIPVKYTGTTTNAQWTSISNPEDEDAKGNWYDYSKKQWANAVTVKKEALAKYQGQDRVVDQADILGFWVYIPRYTYEVMRRDGTDKPVKEQNFDIKFENTKTPKKRPPACKTGNGKDYRTECNVSRELPLAGGEVSTWTTHPAFSFGKKELNGFWFGKFETTGTTSQPTALPNSINLSGSDNGINGVGSFYSVAKSFGVDDPKNVGGRLVNSPQNSHHLTKLSSHMVNNNDWGAVTYLSFSRYGAGSNGVRINSHLGYRGKDDVCSVTGCGPSSDDSDNIDTYDDGGTLGTQQACSLSDSQRAYNGTLGQLASTTNNLTGIYDMVGGGLEYTASSHISDINTLNTDRHIIQSVRPPYVNNYNFDKPNDCTFDTCGGQALYETNDGGGSQWNKWNLDSYGESGFVTSSAPWFERGGHYGNPLSELVSSAADDGNAVYYGGAFSFRVALAPVSQD